MNYRQTQSSLAQKLLVLMAATALAGCTIVKESLLDPLREGGATDAGTDGEVPMEDAGPEELAVDTCGDPDVMVITETTANIVVDTTVMQADSAPTCGATTPAAGRDAFLAVDVTAGEYWHFHLRPDPTFEGRLELDPFIYMLQDPGGSSCNANACNASQASNVCGSGIDSDEHFAFIASADGRWYLGIDDAVAAEGGRYLLDAIRPNCGNGTGSPEHGEACDDGPTGSGTCDNQCRKIIDSSLPETPEAESNDTVIEANFFDMSVLTEATITGAIGGSCYPDYFTFRVTSGNTPDLMLQSLNPQMSSMNCSSGSSAPYEFALLNSSGTQIQGGSLDPNSCPILTFDNAADGLYTIRLQANDISVPSTYKFKITLTP